MTAGSRTSVLAPPVLLSALLPLEALHGERFGLVDLQVVLGLENRFVQATADLLVRCLYLEERGRGTGKAAQYVLSDRVSWIVDGRIDTSFDTGVGLELVGKFIRSAQWAPDSKCFARRVTISGTIMDQAVKQHRFINAEVEVAIRREITVGIALKYLVKSLQDVGGRIFLLDLLLVDFIPPPPAPAMQRSRKIPAKGKP